jgi:hypothetical protein
MALLYRKISRVKGGTRETVVFFVKKYRGFGVRLHNVLFLIIYRLREPRGKKTSTYGSRSRRFSFIWQLKHVQNHFIFQFDYLYNGYRR